MLSRPLHRTVGAGADSLPAFRHAAANGSRQLHLPVEELLIASNKIKAGWR
jgi:hypothetical protein